MDAREGFLNDVENKSPFWPKNAQKLVYTLYKNGSYYVDKILVGNIH